MAIMQLDNRKSVLLNTFAQAQDNFLSLAGGKVFITKGRDTFEALPIPDAKTEGWREKQSCPFF
jgi:predicted secreted protein